MGATLALLLRPVALVDDTRNYYHTKPTHGARVLDAVLSSYTFQHVLSDDAQQQLLDDVVSFSAVEARVRVAIAHGACVDQSQVLEAVATYGLWYQMEDETTVLDVLVHEGACVVGADVLHISAQRGNMWAGTRLATLGADWGNATTKPLLAFATSIERWIDNGYAMDSFVRAGFFDLDARDKHGVTALMRTAAFPHVYANQAGELNADPARAFAESLVDNGANVHAFDADGNTVWDYALRGNNGTVCARLLDAFVVEGEEDNSGRDGETSMHACSVIAVATDTSLYVKRELEPPTYMANTSVVVVVVVILLVLMVIVLLDNLHAQGRR